MKIVYIFVYKIVYIVYIHSDYLLHTPHAKDVLSKRKTEKVRSGHCTLHPIFTFAYHNTVTAWKVSKYTVLSGPYFPVFRLFFLVRIFLYSDWIRRFTEYIFVFGSSAGKYGPEKTLYLDIFRADPEIMRILQDNLLNPLLVNNSVGCKNGNIGLKTVHKKFL